MKHIQVTFDTQDSQTTDMIMAALIEIGFEGFEQQDEKLVGYVGGEIFDRSAVKEVGERYNVGYETAVVEPQNWNTQWEENFQPVIIEGFCTIKASFHTIETHTPHEILITPKMSFGTGHHATTQLMMMQMQRMDFIDRSVLDFGTGTGILAILAEQLGSRNILAVDTDEWSYENAKENVAMNGCSCVTIEQRSISEEDQQYDVILANINRHILLDNMTLLHKKTAGRGCVVMSGLLHTDDTIITASASAAGFSLRHMQTLGDWLLLVFDKLK